MEEPDMQYGPVKRGWYGDGKQTAMATETERKGGELRGRMSETLVPGAWAEACAAGARIQFYEPAVRQK